MTKNYKTYDQIDSCRLLHLAHYFWISHYMHPYRRFLTMHIHTTFQHAQHKLVAHPRAMSAGNCVRVDICIEFFILFLELLSRLFHLGSDHCTFFHALFEWMIYNIFHWRKLMHGLSLFLMRIHIKKIYKRALPTSFILILINYLSQTFDRKIT